MSYGLMIETNFDNCFGPLHCVCRTKLFRRGREKACLSDQLCLLRQGPQIGTPLILYSGRYWKMSPESWKYIEGQPNLNNS